MPSFQVIQGQFMTVVFVRIPSPRKFLFSENYIPVSGIQKKTVVTTVTDSP